MIGMDRETCMRVSRELIEEAMRDGAAMRTVGGEMVEPNEGMALVDRTVEALRKEGRETMGPKSLRRYWWDLKGKGLVPRDGVLWVIRDGGTMWAGVASIVKVQVAERYVRRVGDRDFFSMNKMAMLTGGV